MISAVAASTSLNSQSFTSSNLPIVVINTGGAPIFDEPKIVADMGIIDNGPGQRNNVTDAFNNYNGKIAIEIRGSSSQSFPKKQYSIELRNAAGEDVSAPLLGMPAEEDWVLFAPYNDKSLMRDVLAYKIGRDMGRYAPRTRYCELVLNSQYQGVYVLIEKIKRDKNRVDINKLDPDENTGNNLTGGYIIKIDKETGSGNGGWTSLYTPPNRSGSQTIYYQYDYPKAADISAPQKNYIRQFMLDFETALVGSNYNNPVTGYSRYIDVDSFIDFFIVNEVSKNVDGYRLSTFLHKQRDSDGGKLVMGPVWDFNLGFGNADYCTSGTPTGWVTSFNTICPTDYWLIPFWWSKLYQDGNYRSKLAARWTELRADKLQTSRLHTYIDSVYAVLNTEAATRNFTRWPVLGQYVWPNFYVGSSFQDEVNWLKNWVTQRMNWLDANMPQVITAAEGSATLQVFPNPFLSELHMEYSLLQAGKFEVEWFDASGKMIHKISVTQPTSGTYQATIPTQTWPSGLYYFRAKPGNDPLLSGKYMRQ
ncbi:MAG: CotH kinase family protein [Cyclobacteriaceae bacterium]|nr:CotH kinase family protein [Cyclobacteriaceae bacterium]